MRHLLIAAAVALLASGGSAAAKQFVVNGDFTQLSNGVGEIDAITTVTGWSGNGGYNFVLNSADAAAPAQAASYPCGTPRTGAPRAGTAFLPSARPAISPPWTAIS
jgi:hypothetical protein